MQGAPRMLKNKKFSSFENQQSLTENFRKFLKEGPGDLAAKSGGALVGVSNPDSGTSRTEKPADILRKRGKRKTMLGSYEEAKSAYLNLTYALDGWTSFEDAEDILERLRDLEGNFVIEKGSGEPPKPMWDVFNDVFWPEDKFIKQHGTLRKWIEKDTKNFWSEWVRSGQTSKDARRLEVGIGNILKTLDAEKDTEMPTGYEREKAKESGNINNFANRGSPVNLNYRDSAGKRVAMGGSDEKSSAALRKIQEIWPKVDEHLGKKYGIQRVKELSTEEKYALLVLDLHDGIYSIQGHEPVDQANENISRKKKKNPIFEEVIMDRGRAGAMEDETKREKAAGTAVAPTTDADSVTPQDDATGTFNDDDFEFEIGEPRIYPEKLKLRADNLGISPEKLLKKRAHAKKSYKKIAQMIKDKTGEEIPAHYKHIDKYAIEKLGLKAGKGGFTNFDQMYDQIEASLSTGGADTEPSGADDGMDFTDAEIQSVRDAGEEAESADRIAKIRKDFAAAKRANDAAGKSSKEYSPPPTRGRGEIDPERGSQIGARGSIQLGPSGMGSRRNPAQGDTPPKPRTRAGKGGSLSLGTKSGLDAKGNVSPGNTLADKARRMGKTAKKGFKRATDITKRDLKKGAKQLKKAADQAALHAQGGDYDNVLSPRERRTNAGSFQESLRETIAQQLRSEPKFQYLFEDSVESKVVDTIIENLMKYDYFRKLALTSSKKPVK